MPPAQPSRGGPSAAKKGTATKIPSTGGKGKGKTVLPGAKRRRKIMKDTIRGITKPAIRRLARRGGVKRISAMIYDEARAALKARLTQILGDCVEYTEYRNAKTITIYEVIHSLRRIGTPIYGFDPDTYTDPKNRKGGAKHHRGDD
ncbi:histone H4 [Colletotrichum karsti]|uniref:Histone H4 n=1 Tax=Colletotrichum karsti TaxID=1095194 RepID=A0A9P6LMR3_9PEZI|nr:histone H4 [Colletotrichum karsti]KAF9881774.1 histone H4 [Colletotrichum karsti]